MYEAITTKFYPDTGLEKIDLPDDFSTTGYSNEDGSPDETSIPVTTCLTLFVLNLFGNMHNKLMASDTSDNGKLVGVVLISAFSTIAISACALAESIVRLVPAILGIFLLCFVDSEAKEQNESCYDMTATFLYLGGTLSLGTLMASVTSGYQMLTQNKIYSAAENVIWWHERIDSPTLMCSSAPEA